VGDGLEDESGWPDLRMRRRADLTQLRDSANGIGVVKSQGFAKPSSTVADIDARSRQQQPVDSSSRNLPSKRC